MTIAPPIPYATSALRHDHVYLGAGHAQNEHRTWIVIGLCGVMMLIEIVGGLFYGSIALIADGLHMSTHAGALLLAALAYRWGRRHAEDPRFSFGTGKFGDLAGFTSAIVLAMIALLIGYEAVTRFLDPVPIRFGEAIPIALLGLGVNIASVWLLGAEHDHHHGHSHHGHSHHASAHAHDDIQHLATWRGAMTLEIFEDAVPPRFRLASVGDGVLSANDTTILTVRPDGSRQTFAMRARGGFLESDQEVAEPHAFAAQVRMGGEVHHLTFEEHIHEDSGHHRDNNMRAAVVHVLADAAVSVLVIAGLLAARWFGWLWMDPLAGIVGALVIASWSYGLVRDTGAILLDMTTNVTLAEQLRSEVEKEGDSVADLHLWRLGPGHLGAIVSIDAYSDRDTAYYRKRFASLSSISHLTVEVIPHQEAGHVKAATL
ncbi:CDF family Co(II)/Ni(II) efflux transporter DmeF [Sphingomonas sp. UYP23]